MCCLKLYTFLHPRAVSFFPIALLATFTVMISSVLKMKEVSNTGKQCSSNPAVVVNQSTAKRRGWTEDGGEVDIDDVEGNLEQEKAFPTRSSDALNNKKIGVELLDLTTVNVRHLKLLNETSLVTSYEDRFYKQLLQSVNHWHLKKMMFESADLPKHWAKLAYFRNTIVGAICCQLMEDESDESNGEQSMSENIFEEDLNHSASSENNGCYESGTKASSNSNSSTDLRLSPQFRHVNILTLASLPSFRRRGVASLLLKKLLEWCQNHAKTIKSVYLHVQTNNEIALKFYKGFDFHFVKRIENYYRRIDPRDAYLLERKISD